MSKTEDKRRAVVQAHQQAAGQLLAYQVARIFDLIEDEQAVGVHNEYVQVIQSLIPENKRPDLPLVLAKAILRYATQ